MTKRYEILDVLKGFSLICIFIIHFNQQFEIENSFTFNNSILNDINSFIKLIIEKFLIGNVYLVFSLIFGINLNYGLKYKTNFVYFIKLILILIIGYLHSLIYNGDILIYYGFLGFLLLLINKLKIKIIYIILIISLLKIQLLIQIFLCYTNNCEFINSFDLQIIDQAKNTYSSKNLFEVIKFNSYLGKYLSIKHYILTDRLMSIFSFFLIGLVIYKNNILSKIESNLNLIRKLVIFNILLLIILFFLNKLSVSSNFNVQIAYKIYLISLQSIFSGILVTLLITYLFYKKINLNFLLNYGKHSLTIYLSQSIFGVFIFYNFGLDLANKTGILIGLFILMFTISIQVKFLKIWTIKNKKGPVEMMLDYFANKFN